MHILGLCNGSVHGNSEILLKAALKAAMAQDPSITTSWIHVPSVSIPRNPPPTMQNANIIPTQLRNDTGLQRRVADDRAVVYDAIMDSDALIISTPIFSHQPAGTLKALSDSILGPYADVSGAYKAVEEKSKTGTTAKDLKIDPRLVKPRVAAFMAVAGSSSCFPEQWTMALPTMHLITYPLHARIIDQVVFPGNANAGAVLIDPENTIERARRLGENVASQIGKPFDDAKYLGPEEKGSCPYCHLLKIEFRQGNRIVCIVCGADGRLVAEPNGDFRPIWDPDSNISGLTLKGKWKHREDIVAQLEKERKRFPGIEDEWEKWKQVDIPMNHLPSNTEPRANF